MARVQGEGADRELVVFWTRRNTQCAECGGEIARGGWLSKRDDEDLCLTCADLDHLSFLPSGDPALTRRSKKHSKLYAVVVEWARARKRFERKGLLVEEDALAQAEAECLADADARERRRVRNAERVEGLDREFVTRFAARIRELYPHCPEGTETRVAEHACRKHSGRVGRSAAAKALEEDAVLLAVRAHIRHVHTRYDDLLMAGHERWEARAEIQGEVFETEYRWQHGREVERG